MSDYIRDKVIVVTGAAGGFGRLISLKAASLGARLVCADINADALGRHGRGRDVTIRASGDGYIL